ncbi:MAG: NAD(P)H-dependent oxidoreductase [Thermodesulfobacteriota bacterium]
MNIFTIHGSPDKEGNSRLLADRVLAAAEKEGAHWEMVNIYDYRVADVWADYFGDALQDDFSKAGNDDMGLLKEKMFGADIIMLATPIYWYQVSGRLKTFLDRWSDTLNPDFSSSLGDKGLAIVSTHSGLNTMHSSRGVQMAMEATARFLGMHWLGGVDAPVQLPGSSGPNEGHFLLADDFGGKLARGENLIGQKIL